MAPKGSFFNNWTVKVLLAFTVYLVFCLLPPITGLDANGQRVIAVLLATIVLWMTEALPVAVTSLLSIFLLAVSTNDVDLQHSLKGFASPILYFVVGILVIGQAVLESGLAKRIALRMLRRARDSFLKLYFQLMAVLPVLAIILPSGITRNAILIPIYENIFTSWGVGKEDARLRSVMLALGVLNPLASSVFLTGGTASITTSTILGGFTWLGWFFMMSLPYYILMFLGFVIIFFWFRPQTKGGRFEISEEATQISRQEVYVISVILITSFLWLTDFLHGMKPALPAILAAVLLLLPKLGVLTWKRFESSVSWTMFFLLGSTMSITKALEDTGVIQWLAVKLSGLLTILAAFPAAIPIFLILLAAFVHIAVPNIAACLTLLVPIVKAFALQLGLSPIICGLIITIAVDSIIFYPIQSLAIMMVYEKGYFNSSDVIKMGLILALLTILVVVLIAVPYWRLLGYSLML